jgi:hypothetical protein
MRGAWICWKPAHLGPIYWSEDPCGAFALRLLHHHRMPNQILLLLGNITVYEEETTGLGSCSITCLSGSVPSFGPCPETKLFGVLINLPGKNYTDSRNERKDILPRERIHYAISLINKWLCCKVSFHPVSFVKSIRIKMCTDTEAAKITGPSKRIRGGDKKDRRAWVWW